MNSSFYLERNLIHDDRTYTEAELLAASNYIVVLAEPGGGKTELMKSLAQQLRTNVLNASLFTYVGASEENISLVIDAVDEVARIDQSGVLKLLTYARKSKPSRVIMSSRSSEWGMASTSIFEKFLGVSPTVVKLQEFSRAEQQAIFNHYAPEEDFIKFTSEITRFNLEMLLPNPQFLKMFIDAYLESGRSFSDKRSIFVLAVERLAKEVNINIPTFSHSLSITQKISYSSEVYAKLLLSGAEGISTIDATASRMHPALPAFFNGRANYDNILSTQLFKPGDNENQHRPVHKIIAEYCAANYIIKRVTDPTDALTLIKCLSIIAPKGTVRDELRGLLGWMASLGNRSIQESIIELDAYAVLANGDPSQLERSSKRQLINRLKEIETSDPYFRRSDFWRRFSAAGFFTQDVVEEVKSIIANSNDGHLRSLILELLKESKANDNLASELIEILLNTNEPGHIRVLAGRCLSNTETHKITGILSVLIFEASNDSLNTAAQIIEKTGIDKFSYKYISGFLRVCAKLYPSHKVQFERVVGTRYFIKKFISSFSRNTIELILDDLTHNIKCICGKDSYECDCRNGMSKICGILTDRFFELTLPPYDPVRIWQWIGNLNFHQNCHSDESKTVQVLKENELLRQQIIAYVFTPLTDKKIISTIKNEKFAGNLHSHSGLNLCPNDRKFIIDLAFEIDNVNLWASFLVFHQRYKTNENQRHNELRQQLRQHALLKPTFMREWAKFNNALKLSEQEHQVWRLRYSRSIKRHDRKRREIRAANIKYLNENRKLVESGRHWNCLVHFADLVLMNPENIESEFGDESLVRNALKNCLDFIAPEVPTLAELANLQCQSKSTQSELILYAACLEIFQAQGNLEHIDKALLTALRTGIYMGYTAVSDVKRDALKAEIDRLIFPDNESAEKYLREYVELQLCQTCSHSDIWLLSGDEIFSGSRRKLSIEWLRCFPNLSIDSIDTLFEIAAQYGNRDCLNEIIEQRCSSIMSAPTATIQDEDFERKKTFWLVRGFYFLGDINHIYWESLKSNKDNFLHFYELSGRMSRSNHQFWPELTPIKIEMILDAFIEKWPHIDLPSYWNHDSSNEEKAYRFLTDLIWSIDSYTSEEATMVLERLIKDDRFIRFHKELQSVYTGQIRKKALIDFEPPTLEDIVDFLDRDSVVTVEGLRQLVIQELNKFQKAIDGGEFDSADRFYEKNERINEVKSTLIIAERLSLRLEPQSISITPEHQLKGQNRSDFTATKLIGGRRRLLVTEVKGQWHRELYSAASTQLYERYSIHPDAEQQGIFLVLWFGENEMVAGRSNHEITTAQELKKSIESILPPNLSRLIDVFILDVSRKVKVTH